VLDRLKPQHIAALHRIAKNTKKGAYPFFRDPKMMIELRKLKDKQDADG
jgi:hypothetical protein